MSSIRLETFSDSVFAIAVTQVRVSDGLLAGWVVLLVVRGRGASGWR